MCDVCILFLVSKVRVKTLKIDFNHKNGSVQVAKINGFRNYVETIISN